MLSELHSQFGTLQAPFAGRKLRWLCATNLYLGEVAELLRQMAEVAIEDAPDNLREGLDKEFQDLKSKLSLLIDGHSGTRVVGAREAGVPLFLGFVPEDVGLEGINLYTRFGEGKLSAPFAEWVWGADNNRPPGGLFSPLTEAERSYRRTNGVPGTNPFPQTARELLMRKSRNIFDPHLGHLRSETTARSMHRSVRGAIGQIAALSSRQATTMGIARNETEGREIQSALGAIARGVRRQWIYAHRGLLRDEG